MNLKTIFIGGASIFFLMVLVEVLIGLRFIRADIKFHKTLGLIILFFGVIHGIAGLIILLG